MIIPTYIAMIPTGRNVLGEHSLADVFVIYLMVFSNTRTSAYRIYRTSRLPNIILL